jgi:DNA-binding FadR family transcriptional regulator
MPGHSVALTVSDVRERILAFIHDACVVPGGRMPTERVLQEELGISRSRIRDALAALEVEGAIHRRVGNGTYLSEVRQRPLLEPALTAMYSPAQLIEARMTFETALPPLIAAKATGADFEAMEKILVSADRASSLEDYERCDMDFHLALARASHNDLLVHFAEILGRERGMEWGDLKAKTTTPERRIAYQVQHWAILKALRRRAATEAEAALRDHVLYIRSALID